MSDWEMVGKPALLFIHMQRAIVKEGSPLDALGHSRATRESGIIPRQQALLKAFRDKGLPVVYVNAITPPDTQIPGIRAILASIAKNNVNIHRHRPMWRSSRSWLPRPANRSSYNWPFGIFEGNDLEKYLKDQGIDTMVSVGVATGMAVGTAVFACADRFYNLISARGCFYRRQPRTARYRLQVDDPGDRSCHHDRGRYRPPVATS